MWRTHSCMPRRHSYRRPVRTGCPFATRVSRRLLPPSPSKPFLEKEVQPEQPVLFPQRHYRPLLGEGPFHSDHLRVALSDISDVSESNLGSHLLLQRKSRLQIGRAHV